jgi:hypothetical protein
MVKSVLVSPECQETWWLAVWVVHQEQNGSNGLARSSGTAERGLGTGGL